MEFLVESKKKLRNKSPEASQKKSGVIPKLISGEVFKMVPKGIRKPTTGRIKKMNLQRNWRWNPRRHSRIIIRQNPRRNSWRIHWWYSRRNIQRIFRKNLHKKSWRNICRVAGIGKDIAAGVSKGIPKKYLKKLLENLQRNS